MVRHTFKKRERLKSRKQIKRLFMEGRSLRAFPLKMIWCTSVTNEHTFPVQFAVSVPKRVFSKAVKRNFVKRLIREVYRKEKHRIYEALEGRNQQIIMMIIYIGREEPTYRLIETAMNRMIRKFTQQEMPKFI